MPKLLPPVPDVKMRLLMIFTLYTLLLSRMPSLEPPVPVVLIVLFSMDTLLRFCR